MSIAVDELLLPLLKKHSWKECSVEYLQELAAKHPYFPLAHLLLTKKMEEVKDENLLHQKSKTSLYFPDPLWLDNLLHEKPEVNVVAQQTLHTKSPHAFEPAFTPQRTVAIDHPADNTIKEEGRELVKADVEIGGNGTGIVEEIKSTEAPVQEDKVGMTLATSTELKEETQSPEALTNIAPMKPSIAEKVQEEEKVAPASEPAMSPVLIKSVAPVSSTELLFEPFHTVDYFASQGIKFSEEEKPTDKLGQQLKSFTEWLKILRKTPVTEISLPANLQTEQKVEKMAAHSLADREVLTEAMAEVWEKQGNKEKAKAIYNKLSLLNPSKSSYFAAKIEHLKHS